jgi:two-component system, sensor histidine kinase PdtaS
MAEMIGRVQGLSAVHGMLSESKWGPLVLSDLCSEIVDATLESISPSSAIATEISPSDIEIGAMQAHHLALALNELVTNTLKHGLGATGEAAISVAISAQDGWTTVEYRDSGPGFSDEALAGLPGATYGGFDLLRGVVRGSLGGEVQFHNDDGAVATIIFESNTETMKRVT